MPVETPVNGIWDLNENNPLTSDSRRQGDDHLRLIKDAVKKTFPAITAAISADATEINKLNGVTVSTAEINYLAGVTSNIQTQLNDPTIMRTNQNNVITGGYLEIDENEFRIDRSLSTTTKDFLKFRSATQVDQWKFRVVRSSDPTVPLALDILNNAAGIVLRIRQNAAALELTSADLFFNGFAMASQAFVDALIATCAKNDDFLVIEHNFSTVATVTTFTLDTGWGTTDFVWGLSGVKRSDGSDPNIRIIGTDDADFKQHINTDNTLLEPTEPAQAAAGQVNFSVRGDVGGTIGWSLRFWARKNI